MKQTHSSFWAHVLRLCLMSSTEHGIYYNLVMSSEAETSPSVMRKQRGISPLHCVSVEMTHHLTMDVLASLQDCFLKFLLCLPQKRYPRTASRAGVELFGDSSPYHNNASDMVML
jgi:hypothetical protein